LEDLALAVPGHSLVEDHNPRVCTMHMPLASVSSSFVRTRLTSNAVGRPVYSILYARLSVSFELVVVMQRAGYNRPGLSILMFADCMHKSALGYDYTSTLMVPSFANSIRVQFIALC